MPTAPLKSLSTVAWGMLLVFIDFRIENLDIVPDPLGWVIAAGGLASLTERHDAFGYAVTACWIALLPSIPEMVGVEHVVIGLITMVASTVVVFATCTGIMATAPKERVPADRIRWLDLWLSVLAFPVALAAKNDRELEPVVLVLVVAVLLVFIWFLVLLFRTAKTEEWPALLVGGD